LLYLPNAFTIKEQPKPLTRLKEISIYSPELAYCDTDNMYMNILTNKVKKMLVKVKQSLYRPEQVLRVPDS
jgi:hypothetical protein